MYKTRVERGINWLNKTYGKDWYKDIDLKILWMGRDDRCILGQLDEDYYSAIYKHGLSVGQAEDKGFMCNRSWENLNNAWIDAIKQLRGEPTNV